MELLQLTYFCETAESESFTATAKKHTVPTSAVSQSIKRLENELGADLFIRQANRIRLSPKGRAFYEKAVQSLALLSDARNEICDDGARGSVKLSIFINRRLVMQTVEKFSRCYPNIDIVTKYSVMPDKEDFDLVVTDLSPEGGCYMGEKLIEEEILLAMHRSHPLASAEHIRAEQLAESPFICTNQGSSLYRITESVCHGMGFSPRIVICSDDPYYIRKCVELGLGVAFVPSASWQGQFSENVLLKRTGEHFRTTYAFHDQRKYVSKSARLFLEMLKEEFCLQQGTET